MTWVRHSQKSHDDWVSTVFRNSDVYATPAVVVFPDRASLARQDWTNTFRPVATFFQKRTCGSELLQDALRSSGPFSSQMTKDVVELDDYPQSGGLLLEVEDEEGNQWRLLLVMSLCICLDDKEARESKCIIQNVNTGARKVGYCRGPCTELWDVFSSACSGNVKGDVLLYAL